LSSTRGPDDRTRYKEAQFGSAVFVIARQGKATPRPTAAQTLALVEKSLDDDKADDIRVIPLAGKSDIADYMVVASGTSSRRLDSITEHLLENLKASGVRGSHAEGRRSGEWVLIDAGDVIVHLFRPEVRDHYAIEKLWEADFARERAAQDAVPA
jgi:ribosome-associated protein